jgi:hypothetical protein
MTSPTLALLWQIWRQHRSTAAALAVVTAAGHLVDAQEAGTEPSSLTILLAMVAFLLLLGVFNYTESTGGRGLGGFPRRLFTLPVTSLRLVSVPMLSGVASSVVLYLLWLGPLSRGGSTSALLVATLFAALMVFYLWTLWTLERAGAAKLVVLGTIATGLFVAGIMPSFPPSPPPAWRSEPAIAGLVAALAVAAFLHAWRHVDRLRHGAARSDRALSIASWIAEATPARRKAFASPASAHFWYEWRTSGMVLPALVTGLIVFLMLPMSVVTSGDGGRTFRLLLAVLATPVALAVPVGIGFSKATFWSDDLAVPSFIAVRPLRSEDFVAIKVKVAGLSAGLAWAAVLLFVAIWLPGWGNLESLSRFAIQIWAFHERSIVMVYGLAALVIAVGVLLTWRSLVTRLWTGLSGKRWQFSASVLAGGFVVILAIAAGVDELPGWLIDDPSRWGIVAWIVAPVVIAKYWLAAYAWRRAPQRSLRAYLPVWLAATAVFLAFGLVLWNMVRIYLPMDADRSRGVVILLALLAVPLARIGLAPAGFDRNRHLS